MPQPTPCLSLKNLFVFCFPPFLHPPSQSEDFLGQAAPPTHRRPKTGTSSFQQNKRQNNFFRPSEGLRGYPWPTLRKPKKSLPVFCWEPEVPFLGFPEVTEGFLRVEEPTCILPGPWKASNQEGEHTKGRESDCWGQQFGHGPRRHRVRMVQHGDPFFSVTFEWLTFTDITSGMTYNFTYASCSSDAVTDWPGCMQFFFFAFHPFLLSYSVLTNSIGSYEKVNLQLTKLES